MRPRLLDLFCGAGGAAMGYHRAGFEVVGVDIEPQPNYPFEFIEGDALGKLTYIMEPGYLAPHGDFDAIHASPPCQAFSAGRNMWKGRLPDGRHPDLVSATRDLIEATGLPYVIENVVGAPLRNPVMICGTALGLGVKRHRLFETNFPVMVPPCDDHENFVVSVFGGGALSRTPRNGGARDAKTGRHSVMQARFHIKHEEAKQAMGIDWMTRDEMSQAIPPAYTEHIGSYLLTEVEHRAKIAA